DEFDQFIEILVDDLNTPKALGVLFNYVRKLNRKIDNDKLSKKEASIGLNFLNKADIILSILKKQDDIPENIVQLVTQRESARKEKNWKLSDDLREELKKKGWIVEDLPDGTKCYPL
ncbi:MAG: cysteine--tRNA ligase, partial [Candidatus Marinimicrobia bacterium]|nr:cysteine--tRNA ligase [Candidatus Neomarinimicrobiota bacterium]